MSKKFIYILIGMLSLSSQIFSQTCNYITSRYLVKKDSNIVYGRDTLYNLQAVDLKMDIYQPIGDSSVSRPLIIWVYGGGFVGGSKEGMANWCSRFTKRGYVTVAIQYRLGFFNDNLVPYVGNIPRPYGAEEPNRAAFRAQQDLKGAIRYLKGLANVYKIDTSLVFLGGQSAGAITCLSAAFMNEESHKPQDCNTISNYTHPLQSLNIKRPDLGSVQGRLNLNGTGTAVQGVINMFGAIIDTSWIKVANNTAIFSYHQSIDYNNEDVVVSSYTKPFFWSLQLNYPWGHGSRIIAQRMKSLGYDSCHSYTYIHPGIAHSLHDESQVDAGVAQLLNNLVCGSICYPIGISNVESSSVNIFPNPVQNELYIQNSGKEEIIVYIYGIDGREVVRSSQQRLEQIKVDVSNLYQGIYLLKVVSGEQVKSAKFVKE